MVKVILIAMLSLLAVVNAAGWALLPAATDHERATLTPGVALAVGGGFAAQDFKPLFPDSAHGHALTPTFASLVSINRLVVSVEQPLGGQGPFAGAPREAEASWCTAGNLGRDTGHADFEWRWDRVAVLNTAASAVAQPRRPQWGHARGRKFWPLRRPSYGAQVWLTRKQP
jgi:hypothetical protein